MDKKLIEEINLLAKKKKKEYSILSGANFVPLLLVQMRLCRWIIISVEVYSYEQSRTHRCCR